MKKSQSLPLIGLMMMFSPLSGFLPAHADADAAIPNLCGTWQASTVNILSGQHNQPTQQTNHQRKVIFQNGRLLRVEKTWETPKNQPQYINNESTINGKELLSGVLIGDQVWLTEQGDLGTEIWTPKADGTIDMAYFEPGNHSLTFYGTLERLAPPPGSCPSTP